MNSSVFDMCGARVVLRPSWYDSKATPSIEEDMHLIMTHTNKTCT